MISKHLFKVLIGFTGMIILGLVSLVLIDHYKTKTSESLTAKTAPPVEASNSTKPTPIKKPIGNKVSPTQINTKTR